MRERRDRNFWVEVFKWSLIWNFLGLLVRSFMFLCKVMIIAMENMIYIAIIVIKKLIHMVEINAEQFKINYAQNHKQKINNKISKMKHFFFCIHCNLKNKTRALKIRSSDLMLRLKKAKYWIIDFLYIYEFQILIIGIGVIVASFIILNLTIK